VANDNSIDITLKATNLTTEAFARASAAIKAIEDQSKKTTKEGSDSWSKWFATIAGGVGVGNLLSDAFESVGAKLIAIPGQLVAIAQRGNDLSDLRAGFDHLTAAVGETGDVVLGKLRTAFGGTVTDFNLMKSANEALSKGVKLTGDEMATMAKASRVMADQVGGNAKESFDAMLSSVARGNEKELKQLGLNLGNIDKSTKAYADSLGVEVSALSKSQQQHAIRNAVLEESKRLLKENGEVENDFNDNIAAGAAQWQNWKDRIGEAIATSPELNAVMGRVSEALTQAFGDDREAQVETITRLIGDMAVASVHAASIIVSGAHEIATAYEQARSMFDRLVGAIKQSEIDEIQKVLSGGVTENKNIGSQSTDQLKARLDYLKGFVQGLKDDAKAAGDAQAKFDALESSAQTWLNGTIAAIEKARASASKNAEKPLLATLLGGDSDGGAGALTKTIDDFTKKVRTMEAELKSAAAHGELVQWAQANRSEIEKLSAQGRVLGVQFPKDLTEAWAKVAGLDIGKDVQRLFDEIAKAQEKAFLDGIKNTMAAYGKNLDAQVEARHDASDAINKQTLSDYDYQVSLIKREADQRKLGLDKTASNYQSTLSAIDDAMRVKMGIAAEIHNDEVAKMKQATDDWGNLTKKWLDDIPNLLQAAFTGGGGFGGAVKGLLSNIGGDLGGKLFGGPNGLGQSLINSLPSAGKLAGMIGNLAGPLGSALGSLGAALGGKLWNSIFGSAGRDLVKDFAASFREFHLDTLQFDPGGGFDQLHKKLLTLGAEGEKLWIALTQGVGKNNPEQARAVIDAITKALDEQKNKEGEVGDAANASADEQTKAAQKIKDSIKGIDDQISSLQDSIAGEAPEEFMGVVERETRDRIAALAEQRKALEEELQQQQEDTKDATNDVGDSVDGVTDSAGAALGMFERWKGAIEDAGGALGNVRFPGDSGGEMPAHASGAYIRRDHVAHVHAGEIVGPQDFIARALADAIKETGVGAAGDVLVYIGNEQLDARVVKVTRKDAATGGLRTRATTGRSY
jgi:hypothetical protein